MKQRIRVLVLVLTCSVFGTTAFAMPMLYDVNGTFADGSVLSGSMTIDPVAGTVTALNLIVGAPTSLTFTVVEAQNLQGPNVHIQAGLLGIDFPDVNLTLPVSTLVGYAGGQLCSVSNNAGCAFISDVFYAPTSINDLKSGSVTAVPEPATLVLLGSGLLATVRVRRRTRAT